MKKIILTLMFVLACLCFVGCPTPNTPNTPSQNSGSNQNQNQNQNQESNVTTSEATKKLLNEAVDLLMEGDIDGGIAKISKAYDGQKNDETKMYYALAELASISVDESVSTLLTENFGIRNYPSKMNALLSGEWLKEYEVTENRGLVEVTEYENGSYVRVSGYEVDYSDINAHYQYYDGQWVTRDSCLSNVSLDENGPYLVYKWDLQGIVSDEELDEAKKYTYENTGEIVEVTTGSVLLPEFEPVNIDGFPAVVEDVETLSFQMIFNLMECNPEGLNDLLDNILKVFGTKFENAKALAASMSNASVTLPEELFDALELEEVLGKSSLKVGKAELNVLVASMEILQGTFQWISSYDWSINVENLEDWLVALTNGSDIELDKIRNIINSKSLSVRSEKAMKESKQSFIDAIDMVAVSYDYLVGDTSEYPEAAIEEIKEMGDLKAEALKIKDAINNGTVYNIPEAEWGIDFGKFFTPGYFSNFIEKDKNGGFKLYININGDGFDEYLTLTSESTFETVEKIYNDCLTDKGVERASWTIVAKVDLTLVDDLLPGLFVEDDLKYPYLPLYFD